MEDDTKHRPAPPITLGGSTGLVYCKRCGYLLSSDSRGDAVGASKLCRNVRITGRDLGIGPSTIEVDRMTRPPVT